MLVRQTNKKAKPRSAGTWRGRSPEPARRQEAARLRAEGLTLAETGWRLGISPQRVCELLRPPPRAKNSEGASRQQNS